MWALNALGLGKLVKNFDKRGNIKKEVFDPTKWKSIGPIYNLRVFMLCRRISVLTLFAHQTTCIITIQTTNHEEKVTCVYICTYLRSDFTKRKVIWYKIMPYSKQTNITGNKNLKRQSVLNFYFNCRAPSFVKIKL